MSKREQKVEWEWNDTFDHECMSWMLRDKGNQRRGYQNETTGQDTRHKEHRRRNKRADKE